ncbi:MAG: hypothetical protein LBJ45_00165 [Holosporaceae bacterium]|jgi:hypothetical protein|nr:hypothetical protein [Holosporaceae bacterium]
MKKNLVKCFFMAAGILSLSDAEGMLNQAQIVDRLIVDYNALSVAIATDPSATTLRAFLGRSDVGTAIHNKTQGRQGYTLNDVIFRDLEGGTATSALIDVFVDVLQSGYCVDASAAFTTTVLRLMKVPALKRAFPEMLDEYLAMEREITERDEEASARAHEAGTDKIDASTATALGAARTKSNAFLVAATERLLKDMQRAPLTVGLDGESVEEHLVRCFGERFPKYTCNELLDAVAFGKQLFKYTYGNGHQWLRYKSIIADNADAFGRLSTAFFLLAVQRMQQKPD